MWMDEGLFGYSESIVTWETLEETNATERYIHFKKLYPMLCESVKQHYIAAYLGIAPESLSRKVLIVYTQAVRLLPKHFRHLESRE